MTYRPRSNSHVHRHVILLAMREGGMFLNLGADSFSLFQAGECNPMDGVAEGGVALPPDVNAEEASRLCSKIDTLPLESTQTAELGDPLPRSTSRMCRIEEHACRSEGIHLAQKADAGHSALRAQVQHQPFVSPANRTCHE